MHIVPENAFCLGCATANPMYDGYIWIPGPGRIHKPLIPNKFKRGKKEEEERHHLTCALRTFAATVAGLRIANIPLNVALLKWSTNGFKILFLYVIENIRLQSAYDIRTYVRHSLFMLFHPIARRTREMCQYISFTIHNSHAQNFSFVWRRCQMCFMNRERCTYGKRRCCRCSQGRRESAYVCVTY